MTVSSAILYFYLAFSLANGQQKMMMEKFGKPRLSETQEIQRMQELDDFLWRRGILFTREELKQKQTESKKDDVSIDEDFFNSILDQDDVPLPDGLENPKYGPQSSASDFIEAYERMERTGNSAEKQYLNSMNRLRLFQYGEEQFMLTGKKSDKLSMVTVNKDKVIRVKCDDKFRITEKIVWKNGTSLQEMKMISRTTLRYNSDTGFIEKRKEEYFETGKITQISYDTRGNPIHVNYGKSNSENNESAKSKKEKLESITREKDILEMKFMKEGLSDEDKKRLREIVELENQLLAEEEKIETEKETLRTYDALGHLVSEEEKGTRQVPDPKRRGQKITVPTSKKNVYIYTKVSSMPDWLFYDEGVLRMETHYESELTYVQTIYFDNDFIVEAKYTAGKRKQEIFYSQGVEIKRKNFD